MSVENAAELRTALQTLGGVGSGIKGHTTERSKIEKFRESVLGTPEERKAEADRQEKLAAAQTHPLAHPRIVLGIDNQSGMEAQRYVAAYGQAFTAAPLPDDIEKGTPQECYKNASLMVMLNKDLTYAEGFGTTPSTGELAFMHAWGVTKDGKVVDPTWEHPEKCQYFGVKYDRSAYLKQLYTAKIYGVLGGTFKQAQGAINTGGKKLRAAGDHPGHEFHGNQFGYHVTSTKSVPKIQRKGITQFNTSNWAKASGGRYGEGEVFAFEHPGDAVHWAAKMDRMQHKEIGTGKISVVKFNAHDWKGWKQDTADPLSQMGAAGKWYKKDGSVSPGDIVGHVPITKQHTSQLFISDQLRKDVILHGLGGQGSGNFGHGGRPGEVGGSSSADSLINKPPEFFQPSNVHGRDTREKFSDLKGHYTAQRQALHEEIIAKYLGDTTPVDHPVAMILGGGMGAGKTTLVEAEGLARGNTVDVNADKIRGDLPEYKPVAGKPISTAYTHEEASDIAKELTERAIAGSRNLTLDGTGDTTLQKLGGKVATMRAAGHEVVAEYVTTSVAEAQARADERGAKIGRFVPPTAMAEAHAAVSRIFPEAIRQKLFDRARLWDTSGSRGSKPVLVASGKGRDLTIHHPAKWDEFLKKGA
jgi:predicted ABC-type ATPase